ncbi:MULTISPECIES: uroporphyrinogen-III synthase [Vreelandella]|uniref:Uroporphyrinogen-III synthase n=2 Tax=Vreelandella TaxID=3137766 RepID=A0A7C9NMI5_9GAMM|nr:MULTISPECIES: uroporphyrinogen-III synthase [Halomonas]NDL70109.1 uroporphyrinogen-III synthase [Halomonas alkaliphila]NYS44433.1 uroporphyrinogen-III synthase [Halomonas zhaodongensis]
MSQPVLICRPGDRGNALAALLREQGACVEQLDVMRLEPLPEDHIQRRVWMDIDQYHKIVVVSPYAAYCLSDALDRYWPQLPIGMNFYSVGRSTASVLFEQLGVRVHIPPLSHGEDTSEALLSLASLKTLTRQRILLVAGEGGRTLLADTLRARGADVTRLAVYRRVYQPPTPAMQQRLLTGNYRALIATSGELLEHLAKWCEQAALNQPLIVSSHRLAKLAGTLGFCDLKVASGATPAALAAVLSRFCNPKGADVDQGT